jgi:hypothetical protein
VHVGGTSVETVAQGTIAGLESGDGQSAIAGAVPKFPTDYAKTSQVTDLGTKIDTLGVRIGGSGVAGSFADGVLTRIKDVKVPYVSADGDTMWDTRMDTTTVDLVAVFSKFDSKAKPSVKRPPAAGDAKLAAEVAALRKQVAELPRQMAVTVTSGGGTTMTPAVAQTSTPRRTIDPEYLDPRFTAPSTGIVIGTIGGSELPPPPPPGSSLKASNSLAVPPAPQAPAVSSGNTGLDGLYKSGPPIAFVQGGRTYFSRELVGRNKYGDPSVPVDGKYRLLGVRGPWKILASTPVLVEEGNYLVYNGVVNGSCQIGWENPSDRAYDGEKNCVWCPVGEFFSDREGTFCLDPDYQIRPVKS